MNEDKAAVALRLSIRAVIGATPGDGQSLRNIITDKFPDGALCFVLENRSLYELNKESSATPDNLTIVQPLGGPGRWLLLGQSTGASSIAEIVGTTPNGVTTSGTALFVAIDDTNFDWQPTGAPAGFALTVNGGVITYSGTQTVRARVTFTGSVEVSSETGGTVWGVIAHNADAIGADPTTSFIPGTQTTEAGAGGLPQIIAAQRTLLLAPGDTVQIALATDTGDNLQLDRATLSVLLA
jgi:hypothetical protein